MLEPDEVRPLRVLAPLQLRLRGHRCTSPLFFLRCYSDIARMASKLALFASPHARPMGAWRMSVVELTNNGTSR